MSNTSDPQPLLYRDSRPINRLDRAFVELPRGIEGVSVSYTSDDSGTAVTIHLRRPMKLHDGSLLPTWTLNSLATLTGGVLRWVSHYSTVLPNDYKQFGDFSEKQTAEVARLRGGILECVLKTYQGKEDLQSLLTPVWSGLEEGWKPGIIMARSLVEQSQGDERNTLTTLLNNYNEICAQRQWVLDPEGIVEHISILAPRAPYWMEVEFTDQPPLGSSLTGSKDLFDGMAELSVKVIQSSESAS